MNDLWKALEEYLAVRRALGFKLRQTERFLRKFVHFAETEGASVITTKLALRWAQEDPAAASVIHSDRLAMVRRFAAWRSADDPRTEIPPPRLLPRRYRRPAPYIYTDDEIDRIIIAAASLPSNHGLRGLTCSTLYGLLAVTGMRIGEAVALDRDDVDMRTGIVAVREGKLGKTRFIPVHVSTAKALEDYSTKRDALLGTRMTSAFFVSDRGRRLSAFTAGENFVKVLQTIGLRVPTPDGGRGRGPRVHDLRHRFAVSTLIHWYRAGADVDLEIPKLATFLGHMGPKEVYWYLQAVPELLELATQRSRSTGSGGAP